MGTQELLEGQKQGCNGAVESLAGATFPSKGSRVPSGGVAGMCAEDRVHFCAARLEPGPRTFRQTSGSQRCRGHRRPQETKARVQASLRRRPADGDQGDSGQLKGASGPRGDPKFKCCIWETSPVAQQLRLWAHGAGGQSRSLVRELDAMCCN